MMRFAIALGLMLTAVPAAAQFDIAPAVPRAPSRLAPLDPASPWHARFAEAARALQPALASGAESEWLPLFGGRWLGAADRARIGALLTDNSAAFRRVLADGRDSESVILGWQPPEGAAAYAALADRPEADAIICWRPGGDRSDWPRTAAEAEDRAAHACVRLSYSVRAEPHQWRAFLDAPLPTD